MIKPKTSLKGKVTTSAKLQGKTNASIIKEYPELEEITVKPTLDEQELTPSKYGYSKITIEGIPATDVTIVPSEEQQNLKGIFKEVNINPIQTEEITTDLDFSSSDAIELKAQKGAYIKKATIKKDTNLSPENIKKGITLFGVEGGFDAVDTRDATATSNDVVVGKTAYVNNMKLEGSIPDNGELDYTPLEEEQLIPTGYTLGGRISAVDITALQEYKDCLELSKQIVPSEYIQVEYITVKAGNGFDLGVPLWSKSIWDLEVEFSVDEIRNYQHIFSIHDDDADHESWIDFTGNYWLRLSSGVKKDGGSCQVNRKTKIRHKWTNGSCELYQDDVKKKIVSYAPFTSPLNLRFGKRQTTYFTGNIYSIKMYQDNNHVLVGDFIPVINNSNGEATLYNLVTKTFVTNLGINNNIAGPQV